MGRHRKLKNRKKNNFHHLTPKSRGGSTEDSNLLEISKEKHILLHQIFHNLTLREIIVLLQRLERIKCVAK